ncbi:MAG: hypothetical protein NZ553_18015 [Caldilinea sp.]|nr:hypothetical protein [Caldilinea sp.]MDW8442379.1 hypothetical protein [Caldilineaceae bacterium]
MREVVAQGEDLHQVDPPRATVIGLGSVASRPVTVLTNCATVDGPSSGPL